MELIISQDQAAQSERAARDLVTLVKDLRNPLICVASGDSPAGLYQKLAQWQKQGDLDTSGWYFLGLDEWQGMNGRDEGSCRFHLDRQLFAPLEVPQEHICFFDGKGDVDRECKKAEDFIRDHG